MSTTAPIKKPWPRAVLIGAAILAAWLLLGVLPMLLKHVSGPSASSIALVDHVEMLLAARKSGNLQVPAHIVLRCSTWPSDQEKAAFVSLVDLMNDRDFGQYAAYHAADLLPQGRSMQEFAAGNAQVQAALRKALVSDDLIVRMYASTMLKQPLPQLSVALAKSPSAPSASGETTASLRASAAEAGFKVVADEAEADLIVEQSTFLKYWDRQGRLLAWGSEVSETTTLTGGAWFSKDQDGVHVVPRSPRPRELASQPLKSSYFNPRRRAGRGRVLLKGPDWLQSRIAQMVMSDVDADIIRGEADAQAVLECAYEQTTLGHYNMGGGSRLHYKLTLGVYRSADSRTPLWTRTSEASDPEVIRLDGRDHRAETKFWQDVEANLRPELISALRRAFSTGH